MAIQTTKRVVCDIGPRHTGEIRAWRLTIDRESKVLDLCPSCSRPLDKLWSQGGATTHTNGRMRVMTMGEIEASKTKKTPQPG